jgi:hypothetical protein
MSQYLPTSTSSLSPLTRNRRASRASPLMILPSSNSHTSPRARQSRFSYPYLSNRFIFRALRIIVPGVLLSVAAFFWLYELHVEVTPYRRTWVERAIDPVPPLAGCFDPSAVHADYNLTNALHGARHTEVHAGMPMRLGLDCYDFAGTIQPAPHTPPPAAPARFHTYWRVDLAPFGPRQEWMLKSFLATQPPAHSRLTIWSNGDLRENPTIARYLAEWPAVFDTRVADVRAMARGTALEGSPRLDDVFDPRAWVDGDVVRLLALWQEGGAWIDMDTLLTRDFAPLLEHEFVTQWDCYGACPSTPTSLVCVPFARLAWPQRVAGISRCIATTPATFPYYSPPAAPPLCATLRLTLCAGKIYQTLNGAFMNFHKHSPYLCEAFHIMATSEAPRPSSTDWGALLYLKLWRRLSRAGIRPFAVLPHCLTDARSCRLDNRLPDPFTPDPHGGGWTQGLGREEGGGLDVRLGKVFAVHLHNQWDKHFPEGGWVDRLLLRRYESTLADHRGEL